MRGKRPWGPSDTAVLKQLAGEATDGEIAKRIGLSKRTVRQHRCDLDLPACRTPRWARSYHFDYCPRLLQPID